MPVVTIEDFTEDTAPQDADLLVTSDATTSEFQKVTIANLRGAVHAPKMETLNGTTTLTSADSGKVYYFVGLPGSPVRLNLPAAASGLIYTLVNHTASSDIGFSPDGTDNIRAGTAGKDFEDLGADVGVLVTVVGTASNGWVITNIFGSNWTFET